MEAPDFTLADFAACCEREAAFRRSCYPKWDKVASVADLSPKRARELAMMEAMAQAWREVEADLASLSAAATPPQVFPPACPRCLQRGAACLCEPPPF